MLTADLLYSKTDSVLGTFVEKGKVQEVSLQHLVLFIRDTRGSAHFGGHGGGKEERGGGKEDRGGGKEERGGGKEERGGGKEERGGGKEERCGGGEGVNGLEVFLGSNLKTASRSEIKRQPPLGEIVGLLLNKGIFF